VLTCHWYVNVPEPEAATVNVLESPVQAAVLTGLVTMVGGLFTVIATVPEEEEHWVVKEISSNAKSLPLRTVLLFTMAISAVVLEPEFHVVLN
jgi:cellobiose-specific phosphotransferase system component IIC